MTTGRRPATVPTRRATSPLRRLRRGLTLAPLILALAACGGSGDDAADDSVGPGETGSRDFCIDYYEIVNTDQDPDAGLSSTRDALMRLASIAPADIADDMALQVDSVERAIEAGGSEPDDQQAAYFDIFSEDEVAASFDRIGNYAANNCAPTDGDS